MLQVTNQVTRDSSTGPLKPALGRSWSFVPSTRVLLESKEGSWEKGTSQRAASLAKSPRQVRLLLDPACLGNAAVGLALAPVGVGQEPASLGEPWPWERSSCSLAGCAEEKRIRSQQPGLVFIDRINGWHRFQSGSLCSWCWSHSADGVWAVRVLWKWL